jgi:hypothetical protein
MRIIMKELNSGESRDLNPIVTTARTTRRNSNPALLQAQEITTAMQWSLNGLINLSNEEWMKFTLEQSLVTSATSQDLEMLMQLISHDTSVANVLSTAAFNEDEMDDTIEITAIAPGDFSRLFASSQPSISEAINSEISISDNDDAEFLTAMSVDAPQNPELCELTDIDFEISDDEAQTGDEFQFLDNMQATTMFSDN